MLILFIVKCNNTFYFIYLNCLLQFKLKNMIKLPFIILFSSSLVMLCLSIMILFIITKQLFKNNNISLNLIVFILIMINIIISRSYVVYDFLNNTPQDISSYVFNPSKKRGAGIYWYVFPGLWYLYVSNFVFLDKLKTFASSIIYYMVILGYMVFDIYKFDYNFGSSHYLSPISFVFFYTLFFVFLIIMIKYKSIKNHTLTYRLWLSYCLVSFFLVIIRILIISKPDTNYYFLREWLLFANVIWIIGLVILILFPRIFSGDILTENRILNKRKTDLESIYSKINFWSIRKPIIKNNDFNNRFQILEKIQQIENKLIIGNLSLDLLNSQVEFSNVCGINHSTFISFFNEYSNFSWSKYKKGIQVMSSIYLIKNGFLNEKTMDHLSVEVNFTNRVTLFNNFKFFLNSNPSEFIP